MVPADDVTFDSNTYLLTKQRAEQLKAPSPTPAPEPNPDPVIPPATQCRNRTPTRRAGNNPFSRPVRPP